MEQTLLLMMEEKKNNTKKGRERPKKVKLNENKKMRKML